VRGLPPRAPGLLLAALVGVQIGLAAWFLGNRLPGTAAALWGLPLDDAWIHLVYGRGLLESGLPEYNPGQVETGFTSPLQALVAAVAVAISRLGVPVGLALKLLTLACTLPATLLAARLGERLGGAAAGLAAASLLAFSPTWAFASVSGMEVGLCGSLILAAFLAREQDRPLAAGLALALAVLSRPEAALLAPLLALGLGARGVARLLLPPLLLGLAWVGFNLAVTGLPLPATFYVKQGGLDAGGLGTAAQILRSAWPVFGSGVGLLALGIAALAGARRLGLLLAGPLWLAAVAVGRSIGVDDQYYYFLRYFLPVEPILMVGVGLGLARAAQHRLGLLAWLALAVVLVSDLPELGRRRALYAWNCQNIEEMQGGAALFLARNGAAGERVGSVDAGRIRYSSGLPVLDVIGLNNHRITRSAEQRPDLWTDPARVADWMDREGLQWLYLFPYDAPFTYAERDPGRFFEIAWRFEADPYTVAGPSQSLVWLLRRLPPPPPDPTPEG